MTTKKIQPKQQEQINKKLNEFIEKEYKTYFKEVSSDYVELFKNVDFKEFSERVSELILEGFEFEQPFISRNDYYSCSGFYDDLTRFDEELSDKDTTDLIDYSLEKIELKSYEYSEDFLSEQIKECFSTLFNGVDIFKIIKISRDDAYIVISDEDVKINIPEEINNYDKFEDFLDELEDRLEDINKDNLIMGYFANFHREVFKWFCDTTELDKNIKDLDLQIQINIKEELKNRKLNLMITKHNEHEILKILKQEFKNALKYKEDYIKIIDEEIKSIKNEGK